jgi:hypothetical protein
LCRTETPFAHPSAEFKEAFSLFDKGSLPPFLPSPLSHRLFPSLAALETPGRFALASRPLLKESRVLFRFDPPFISRASDLLPAVTASAFPASSLPLISLSFLVRSSRRRWNHYDQGARNRHAIARSEPHRGGAHGHGQRGPSSASSVLARQRSYSLLGD